MSDVAPEDPGHLPTDPGGPETAAEPVPGPAVEPTSTAGMLLTLAAALPPTAIEELWIFPPRRIGPGQSTVVVASVFDDDADSDRRRIFTTRFTVVRGAKGNPELRRETTEDGAAPAERVARVVDGVLRRLEEEPAPPRHARIDGSPERWAELLATVAAADAR